MKASRFLLFYSIAISLLIAAFVGANLWHERQQALTDASERLTGLNLALAEQLERSLQAVDLALADVVNTVGRNADWAAPEIHRTLKTYASVLPQIRAIAVVDAAGNIVNDSATHPLVPIFIGDREHFRFLQANPQSGMFIAKPFKSRRDQEWTVVLARPVVDRGGAFRGVVFARMQPSHFQSLYHNVLHLAGSGVTVFRRDGTLLFRQPHVEEMVGRDMSGVALFSAMLPTAEHGTYEALAVADAQLRLFSYKALRAYPLVINSHQRKDVVLGNWRMNSARALLVIALALLAGQWLIRRLLGAMRQQESDAEALRLSASVFEHTQEGILITDAAQHIIQVNRAFTRLTGYTLDDLRGKSPGVLRSGRHDKAFYEAMWRTIEDCGEWRSEIWNVRKDGETFAGILNISAVKNPAGKVTHYVAVYADITDLKNTQHTLERLANFDALTGLPNRMLLADRMDLAIARARRHEQLLAVCFLDLDGFKPVNDSHGHEIGDQLLAQVAERLRGAIRADDTAARVGGDEFVLLLSDLNTVEECEVALLRLVEDLNAPFAIGGQRLAISASIGVAIYPFDDAEPDMLLRLADHAMYRAKQNGRGRFHFFDAAEMADTAIRG